MTRIHTPIVLGKTSQEYFNLGYSRIKELNNPNILLDGTFFYKISAPATNIAFAIELALKAVLLSYENLYKQDHNISNLFDLLEVSDRNQLIKNYTEIVVEALPHAAFCQHDAKPTHQIAKSPEEEVRLKLKIHEKAFVHWRYFASFTLDNNGMIDSIEFDFGFMCRFYLATFKLLASITS
jgi:HEPN domain-containing protein